MQQAEALEEHEQRGQHGQHPEKREQDARAGDEAELGEAPEIGDHEQEERRRGGEGRRDDRLAGAGERGDGGVLRGEAALPLFGVAGVVVDAVVDAHAEEHEPEGRRHQVELAVDALGEAGRPREAGQQRRRDGHGEHGRAQHLGPEGAQVEAAAGTGAVALVAEVHDHDGQHERDARAERAGHVVGDGVQFDAGEQQPPGAHGLQPRRVRLRVHRAEEAVEAAVERVHAGHAVGLRREEAHHEHGGVRREEQRAAHDALVVLAQQLPPLGDLLGRLRVEVEVERVGLQARPQAELPQVVRERVEFGVGGEVEALRCMKRVSRRNS